MLSDVENKLGCIQSCPLVVRIWPLRVGHNSFRTDNPHPTYNDLRTLCMGYDRHCNIHILPMIHHGFFAKLSFVHSSLGSPNRYNTRGNTAAFLARMSTRQCPHVNQGGYPMLLHTCLHCLAHILSTSKRDYRDYNAGPTLFS